MSGSQKVQYAVKHITRNVLEVTHCHFQTPACSFKTNDVQQQKIDPMLIVYGASS